MGQCFSPRVVASIGVLVLESLHCTWVPGLAFPRLVNGIHFIRQSEGTGIIEGLTVGSTKVRSLQHHVNISKSQN